MVVIRMIVLALATWRIAHMVVNEPGPLNVFGLLRNLVGVDYTQDPENQPNFVASLISCVWCFSVWVGIALGIFYWHWVGAFDPWEVIVWGILYGLGYSAVACLINWYVGH